MDNSQEKIRAYALEGLDELQESRTQDMDDQKLIGSQAAANELNELRALRAEQAMFNWQLFITTWVVMFAMMYFFSNEQMPYVTILGIAWSFGMARYDYLIHRIGIFLIKTGSPWEHSPARNSDNWILAVADIGSMSPILFMFMMAQFDSWLHGHYAVTIITTVMFLSGLGLLAIAASMRKKHF